MGREARRVSPDWKHPEDKCLHDGVTLKSSLDDWDETEANWLRRNFPEWAGEDCHGMSYAEWAGERPAPDDYMPPWSEEEATHWQMYETTTEGSPISPVMPDPESLAHWLEDNNASWFADKTCNFDRWMQIIDSPGASLPIFVKRNQ